MNKMFKKNNLLPDRINNLARLYQRISSNKKEGDDYKLSLILKFIVGNYHSNIEWHIKNKYGAHDDDLLGDTVYEIHKLLLKENINNPYGYILSGLRYYIKNYVNKNIFYPELSSWKIREYYRMKNMSDSEFELNKDKFNNIQNQIIKKTDMTSELEGIIHEEYIPDTKYKYHGILDSLEGDEFEILNMYYTKKMTYQQIGCIYNKDKSTIKRRIDKLVDKLKVML